MIKNVFIPEKIGSYYIFAKRVIGLDIGKTHVNATQILLKGRSIMLEKCLEIALEPGSVANYDERAVKAIAEILALVDSYDALHTSLSSSLAIFKELKLPFLDQSKINMVINYEVEPLLPFSANDAVIDFIITKQIPEEKSSEILVAAVPKQHIAHHLSLLVQAGANPNLITIDLFALYGVYTMIPSYVNLAGGTVLIDIGSYSTSIAYLYNGQLRLIRSLPKGVLTQAKTLSQNLDIQANDALENILRFGIEKHMDSAYTQAATAVFTDFWQEIAFTLNSFSSQREHKQMINQILLLGRGADIKGLPSFVTHLIGVPCELFQINRLTQDTTHTFITKNGIPHANIISLCAALPTPLTASFNLLQHEFIQTSDTTLFKQQGIAACALITLILIILIQHNFFQLRKLNNDALRAEEEVITTLKKQFKKISPEDNDLESVVKKAQSEVQKEEKLWFSFANPARVSFLQYLLELTSRIDKEELGFTIDALSLTDNNLTIEAHVKDYNALALLEKELKKSKLFKKVEAQDSPDFKMKIQLT